MSIKNLFNTGVTTKLVSLLLAFAIVPILFVTFQVFSSFDDIKEQSAVRFEDAAETVADKIDRNLFERYGDVQAFGLNHAVFNRDAWGKVGDQNPIVQAMNQYVEKYGIYFLTVLVDTSGNVIAINSKNAKGEAINSAPLYRKNFSNAAWFKALQGNNYTTKMPFTAAGNDISTGTFIEDLHIDEDVKTAYTGIDGMTLGFSSPVYDQEGKVIAYWSNRTRFSVVEEIFAQQYSTLKKGGYPGAELTLLDSVGRVLVDHDPSTRGTEAVTRDLQNVIMKLNLAERNVTAAVNAVAGKSGHEYAVHARKKITQAAGYAHLKGSLGYPGMNWSVLVRVPEDEAAPWLAAIQATLFGIIGICVAISAVLGFLIGKKVVVGIKSIVSVAEQGASGDLTSRIHVTSKDEFGQLGNAFNAMMEKMNSVVNQVRSGSDQILNAASEISEGNMNLSQRTEEQASSLEETASSMEEMTSTVKQNADNAAQANQLAVNARNQAEDGGKVVSDAVKAMAEINESSRKIADIIGAVEEIAFQTNLLALNAAVEAARAGEQGRGFAVVATEVRTLAQRSAESAKEIKDLIVDSVNKVKSGSELVDKSGKTLEEIVASVKKVTDIVSEIAAASQEQSTGIDQVNKAVMQMDETTQQNAALVEEAASASKAMEDQAQNLNQLIAFFKVDNSGVGASASGSSNVVERRGPTRPFKNSPAKAPSSASPAQKASPVPAKKTGTFDDEWNEF